MNPLIDIQDKRVREVAADVLDGDKAHVTKFVASKNLLTALPGDFAAKLSNLTTVDLSYNQLTELPASLLELAQLEELLLTGNRITTFPADWSRWVRLARLDLINNRLTELPAGLASVAATLTTLDLERNCLSSIAPGALRGFHKLARLSFSNNCLTSLPDDLFVDLSALKSLLLANNALESIPDAMASHLPSLERLDLSHNALTSLPESLGTLPSLVGISVRDNRLRELPDSVIPPSLRELVLRENELSALPVSLWCATGMQMLDAAHNRLSHVSDEIAALESLRHLNLAMNQLSSVPEAVGSLFELESLNVAFNQLRELPASIGALSSLLYLFAAYNQLSALPELEQCHNLSELHVSGNRDITTLPESLWTLSSSLTKLYASNLSLESLPPQVGDLSDLEVLDVSYNRLTSLPNEIGQLQRLRRLAFTRNKVSVLPELDELYEMQQLDLSFNDFTEVPVSDLERLLDRGCEVLFDGNPAVATTSADKLPDGALHLHQSERFRIGFADKIGKRPTMEDAMALCGKLGDDAALDFLGLYDGHAGREAATYAGKHVHAVALADIRDNGTEPLAALEAAYTTVNKQFESVVKSGRVNSKYCGATAASLLIDHERKCFLVNAGDTRVVLARGDTAVRLTYDHKPYDPLEEDRIRGLDGYVIGSMGRVNGQLAVPRAIGDYYMHPWVTEKPFTNSIALEPQDHCLIIGCDGVWDEVSDQVAVEQAMLERDPFIASCRIRDLAYSLGSDDNISVIVVQLQPTASAPDA